LSPPKVQSVESLIADFVAGLMRTVVALRRQEEERKQREAEQQETSTGGDAAPQRHSRRGEKAGAIKQMD
jgi:hypothetical protein